MSREIKFRAWDKRYEQYHEGTHRLMIRIDGKIYNSEYGDLQCERFIIEQYTGLKDKSGIEIYEGDIVECWTSDFFGEIEQRCVMVASFDYSSFLALTASGSQVVLGNIHENPELLNG